MPIRTLTSTRPYSLLRGTSADEYVLGYGVTLAGEYPEENPRGATSNDVLYGGGGSDAVYGGGGSDQLYGDAGNDTLRGGTGADFLSGGDGADLLYGDADNDVLRGDAGNDTLYGGDGNDILYGGSGDDRLIGGKGYNVLYGDAGTDTVVYEGGVASYKFAWVGAALQVSAATSADTIDNSVEKLSIGGNVYTIGGVIAENDSAKGGENSLAIAQSALLANDINLKNKSTLAMLTDAHGQVGTTTEGVKVYLKNGVLGFASDETGYDYLDKDQIFQTKFTYTLGNGSGLNDTAEVALTLTGANDAAIFSGDLHGRVILGHSTQIYGDADNSDVDASARQDTFRTINDGMAAYGSFTVAADGKWSYTVNADNEVVASLKFGDSLADSFQLTSEDGTTTTVAIDIAKLSAAYYTGGYNPWGTSNQAAAMNTVFGNDMWAAGNGVLTADVFRDAGFVYIDGGDGQTQWFESFVSNNRDAMEGFVDNGGSLFINAARWDGTPGFDLGFGVKLNEGYSYTGSAIDASHPIFDASTGTSWTGNYFSHDYLTWSDSVDVVPLISGSAGEPVLAELHYGDGLVLFGGITSPYFHYPSAEAQSLLVNIIGYTAGLMDFA